MASMQHLLGAGIAISLSVFVFAVMFPMSMDQVAAANTTGWNTGVATMWDTLLPVLAIVAFVVALVMGVMAVRSKRGIAPVPALAVVVMASNAVNVFKAFQLRLRKVFKGAD